MGREWDGVRWGGDEMEGRGEEGREGEQGRREGEGRPPMLEMR